MKDVGLHLENERIDLFSGGFSNLNFLVTLDNKKKVVRFFPEGAEVAEREFAIINLARKHNINVPLLTPKLFYVGASVALIMDYFEGESLASLLERQPNISPGLFNKIGQELAKVHKVAFASAGWIGSGGGVTPFGANFSILENFVLPALSGRAGRKTRNAGHSRVKSIFRKKLATS